MKGATGSGKADFPKKESRFRRKFAELGKIQIQTEKLQKNFKKFQNLEFLVCFSRRHEHRRRLPSSASPQAPPANVFSISTPRCLMKHIRHGSNLMAFDENFGYFKRAQQTFPLSEKAFTLLEWHFPIFFFSILVALYQ